MGDEIENEKGSSLYLPEELVTEILCYLPVKSLIRFTCVCKSWLSLIKNNHEFATKQYVTRATTSSKVLDNIDCMLNGEYNGKNCMYSFTEAKTLRPLKNFEWLPDREAYLDVVNSCHGIICFVRCGAKLEIMLCNPSIQEVTLLTPWRDEWGRVVGFGFDSVKNDYKVVLYRCSCMDPHKYFVVYSTRHGQWRNLPETATPYLQYMNYFFGGHSNASNGNGRMCNWLHYIERKKVLLSFDMTEEVMRDFALPEDVRSHQDELVSSSRWRACLCYLGEPPNSYVDVWVLKDDWIWSKEISVTFLDEEVGLLRPLSFWLNDKELLVSVQRKEVRAKGNGTRMKIIEDVCHYNIDNKQLSRTGRGSLPTKCYSRGYVESLISIEKFMSPSSYRHGEYSRQRLFQASKHQESIESDGECVFREVRGKGVHWSCTFKLGS